MKECPKCKTMLEDDEMFCHECGTKQEIEEVAAQNEDTSAPLEKRCIYCGETIDEDSAFCPYCGKSQTVEEDVKDVEPEERVEEPQPEEKPVPEEKTEPKQNENPVSETLKEEVKEEKKEIPAQKAPEEQKQPTYESEVEKKPKSWIWALLGLLAIVGVIWYFNLYEAESITNGSDMDESYILADKDTEVGDDVNDSEAIISFLTQMYNNSYYNDYGFLESHCTRHLLSVLENEYDYDCENGPCYGMWLFRTIAQEWKDPSGNKDGIVSVKDLGKGWFECEFYDGGWRGVKRIKAYIDHGNVMMDMIETVYDECLEKIQNEAESQDSI